MLRYRDLGRSMTIVASAVLTAASTALVPVPAFAELRHRDLTVEQNLALEEAGLGTRVSWKVEVAS